MRSFTRLELFQYDGREGRPAYVAFEGKVYDMTQSPSFEGGTHVGVHDAGLDLTEAMWNAPHGPEVLDKYPVVGELTP